MKLKHIRPEIRDFYKLTKQTAALRVFREQEREQDADYQIQLYLDTREKYEGH